QGCGVEPGQHILGNGVDQVARGVDLFDAGQEGGAGRDPAVQDGRDRCAKGREIRVVADGRAHLIGGNQWIGIARPRVRAEERGAQGGHDGPEVAQRVNVPLRHAAVEVGGDVLQILGVGAVDVAGDVQVEVV